MNHSIFSCHTNQQKINKWLVQEFKWNKTSLRAPLGVGKFGMSGGSIWKCKRTFTCTSKLCLVLFKSGRFFRATRFMSKMGKYALLW